MRHSVFAALSAAVMLVGVAIAGQGEPVEATPRRTIFDGKSLDGWQQVGPGKMVLVDGGIRTEGGMGLLWYTKENFETPR